MNTFGRFLRVQIWGESHQKSVGVLIDGCPAGIRIEAEDFSNDLQRRKTGAKGTSPRKEADTPNILSGIHNQHTTGAPILIAFENGNTKSQDYNFRHHPRPGHADFTANIKYKGYNDDRGGGHFSGRLTVGLVSAGVIAKKILSPSKVSARISQIGGNEDFNATINAVIKERNSIGAIIECTVTNVPIGLGEPFFHSAEALISQGIFSIPGIKGIEFGVGFQAATMRGSDYNDVIIDSKGTTKTNNAGGINGGITNGNDIFFRVAVRPTASIGLSQQSWDFNADKLSELKIGGRHDACIALRMPVIVEAVTAIALADLKLANSVRLD